MVECSLYLMKNFAFLVHFGYYLIAFLCFFIIFCTVFEVDVQVSCHSLIERFDDPRNIPQ